MKADGLVSSHVADGKGRGWDFAAWYRNPRITLHVQTLLLPPSSPSKLLLAPGFAACAGTAAVTAACRHDRPRTAVAM